MQSKSWETLGWKKHKLESRLLGEISITSDRQMTPPLWQKQRRQWHPTPVFLPGKSHGWRSLVGYSPRGREESDMTERLHFHFSLSCTREGNGSPLQYSCLENPRDEGAWWAAVYGITQSWTWLMWLSSSSSMVESEEELKSLLMKVKEKSKKVGLNSTFRKLRSWHLVPSPHGK